MTENFLLKVSKSQKSKKPSSRRVFSEDNLETPHRFGKDLDDAEKEPPAKRRRSSRSSSSKKSGFTTPPGRAYGPVAAGKSTPTVLRAPGKSSWESHSELLGKVQSPIVGRPSDAPETDCGKRSGTATPCMSLSSPGHSVGVVVSIDRSKVALPPERDLKSIDRGSVSSETIGIQKVSISEGSIVTDPIPDDSIISRSIIPESIPPGSIFSESIHPGSIIPESIPPGSITNRSIPPGSITEGSPNPVSITKMVSITDGSTIAGSIANRPIFSESIINRSIPSGRLFSVDSTSPDSISNRSIASTSNRRMVSIPMEVLSDGTNHNQWLVNPESGLMERSSNSSSNYTRAFKTVEPNSAQWSGIQLLPSSPKLVYTRSKAPAALGAPPPVAKVSSTPSILTELGEPPEGALEWYKKLLEANKRSSASQLSTQTTYVHDVQPSILVPNMEPILIESRNEEFQESSSEGEEEIFTTDHRSNPSHHSLGPHPEETVRRSLINAASSVCIDDQIPQSQDCDSEGDTPGQDQPRLKLPERILGFFKKYAPEAGFEPEEKQGRKGFLARSSEKNQNFRLRLPETHKEEFKGAAKVSKTQIRALGKLASQFYFIKEDEDRFLDSKTLSPELIKTASKMHIYKSHLMDKKGAERALSISTGVRLSVINDMLIELLAASRELNISTDDREEILEALREVSSLMVSQMAVIQNTSDRERREGVMKRLNIQESLIPDMLDRIPVDSPFLCGDDFSDVFKKEIEAQKKAQELSESVREVRKQKSTTFKPQSSLFQQPLKSYSSSSRKRKSDQSSRPHQSSQAHYSQRQYTYQDQPKYVEPKNGVPHQTQRSRGGSNAPRGRGNSRNSSGSASSSQPFHRGGKRLR